MRSAETQKFVFRNFFTSGHRNSDTDLMSDVANLFLLPLLFASSRAVAAGRPVGEKLLHPPVKNDRMKT